MSVVPLPQPAKHAPARPPVKNEVPIKPPRRELPIPRDETLHITRNQLYRSLLQWETAYREGKYGAVDSVHAQYAAEEVAEANTKHMWADLKRRVNANPNGMRTKKAR